MSSFEVGSTPSVPTELCFVTILYKNVMILEVYTYNLVQTLFKSNFLHKVVA